MIPLALFLIAISVNDWLAGNGPSADGAPRSRTNNTAFSFVFAVVAAWITHVVHGSWPATLLALSTLFIGNTLWLSFRRDAGENHKGWLAVTALAATLAIGGFVMPAVAPSVALEASQAYAHLNTYFDSLPWRQLERVNPELALLLLGTLLFLGPTANAIVKTVMIQIRSVDYDASEQQLKGGRYIGPLERWLIFGLALAGQPTAAALVISAKSIIRFPELQSKAERSADKGSSTSDGAQPRAQTIDELTEYFLIGSLLSWLLALVAALPISAATPIG